MALLGAAPAVAAGLLATTVESRVNRVRRSFVVTNLLVTGGGAPLNLVLIAGLHPDLASDDRRRMFRDSGLPGLPFELVYGPDARRGSAQRRPRLRGGPRLIRPRPAPVGDAARRAPATSTARSRRRARSSPHSIPRRSASSASRPRYGRGGAVSRGTSDPAEHPHRGRGLRGAGPDRPGARGQRGQARGAAGDRRRRRAGRGSAAASRTPAGPARRSSSRKHERPRAKRPRPIVGRMFYYVLDAPALPC